MTILPACDTRQQAGVVENPSTSPSRNPSALLGELQRRINPIDDVPPAPRDLGPFNAVDGFFSLPVRFLSLGLTAADWEVAAYMSRRMGVIGHPCLWFAGRSVKDLARGIAEAGICKVRQAELTLKKFVQAKAITIRSQLFRGADHVFCWLNWALRPFTEWTEPQRPHPALKLPGVPSAQPCASPADPTLFFGPECANSCAPTPSSAGFCAPEGVAQPESAGFCATQSHEAGEVMADSAPDPSVEGARTYVDVKALDKDITSTSGRAVVSAPAGPVRKYGSNTVGEILGLLRFAKVPESYTPLIRELQARGVTIPKDYRGLPLLDAPVAQPASTGPALPMSATLRSALASATTATTTPGGSPLLAHVEGWTLEQHLTRLEGSGDLIEAARLAEWIFKTLGEQTGNQISANSHHRDLKLVAEGKLPAEVLKGALADFRSRSAHDPLKAYRGKVNSYLDKQGLRQPNARPNRPSRPERRQRQTVAAFAN